jgi:hypothetical protein
MHMTRVPVVNDDSLPRPKLMTGKQLRSLLAHISTLIGEEDSFGGSLVYEAAEDQDTYRVSASFRSGNSMGQGYVHLIQADDEAGRRR